MTIAMVLIFIVGVGILGYSLTVERPATVVIDPNATFTGFIQSEGDSRIHSVRVFDNVTAIHCILSCPGVDFDLYGRFNEVPSTTLYDFRGYRSGGEDEYYTYPEAGIWHLMVRSYSGIGHYDLTVEFDYE